MTGKDLTALEAKASEVYASIQGDSIWSDVEARTLAEINAVRALRAGTPQ